MVQKSKVKSLIFRVELIINQPELFDILKKNSLRFLNKLIILHRTTSGNITQWFIVIYATLLHFLAISSFWMYKPKTNHFCRGIYMADAGLVFAIILLFL